MKYVCLGYHDENLWNAMSSSQRAALLQENAAYESVLRAKGHYINGQALQGARMATIVRFGNGNITVTDGPFTETKEQLGGVMVLEANDLNHAIQLIAKLPCMRVGGSLEIRPINENVYGDNS